jgi:hypothetical protein
VVRLIVSKHCDISSFANHIKSMKNITCLFVAALFGAAIALGLGAASSPISHQAFEYKVIYGESTTPDWKKESALLSKAGTDGWELVAVTTVQGFDPVLYLKRPLLK